MFHKFILVLFLFVIQLTLIQAQKPFEPASCYQTKSKMSSLAKTTINDNRGDFINILNYNIDLDISNFSSKELSGNTQVRFKALTVGITSIELDLLILAIDSITYMDSKITSYTYNDSLIHIDFPTVLVKNNDYRVKVFYNGAPIQTSGDWGGFFWGNTYAYNVGVSFTEDVHNFGKAWFPCFDNFTERSTYDFSIKTQGTHKAFCNGLLTNEILNGDGTKTWKWKLNQEIPTYLASVAVANYATVFDTYSGSSSIPIQLAARYQDTINLKNSFIHLKDAMSSYEDKFGKYRFDRIGYCVTDFSAGAMEHATNITYMAYAVDGTTAWETLMAHELSHHWWGNNTTYETAEDMWLNEGFASFSEAIFTESVYGTAAYKNYSRANHDEVLRRVHVKDGEYLPVAGIPSHQTYSSTVYDKGADMVHTLRGILGDDLFFTALINFQEEKQFSAITTDMFQEYLSQYANLNLTSFFNTWIKEPGFHHYSIAHFEKETNENVTSVQGTLKQKLWETDAYTDFLPLEITFFDADWNRVNETIFVYGECSEFQFNLDFDPVFWAIDLEEKIQDATVDKYEIIKATGVKNFGFARLELDVQNITDSALVRVTHHFIKPDPMEDKTTSYHLSPNRYWSVAGIFPTDFNTNAKFLFDGTLSTTTGFLDNEFIDVSEDSLVLMFRENASQDWILVDSFVLSTQGSTTNKKGFISVFNLEKGDYVLAKKDLSKAQDLATKPECVYTSIDNLESLEKVINIYPVPSKNYLNIEFLTTDLGIKQLKVFNILGKEIKKFEINQSEKLKTISTIDWPKGAYIISFRNETNKNIFSKKIVVK